MNNFSEHSEWIAKQCAEARESGIRDTLEEVSVAKVIADLYARLVLTEDKLAKVYEVLEGSINE